MQSGKLRDRITLQRQMVTYDEYGAEVISWSSIATLWASVLPGSVGERFVAGAVQELSKITHTIRIRYRADITPKMRFVWGTRNLYINTIVDPTGRRAELLISCEEEQLG
jgi:SPP1 family predicted phage head-tail adaptor